MSNSSVACCVCGNDVRSELDVVVLPGSEGDAEVFASCIDTKKCHDKAAWDTCPCCGIPEAPHPGCCDHSWERCAKCGTAGPTSTDIDMQEVDIRWVDGSWMCRSCYDKAHRDDCPKWTNNMPCSSDLY